MRLDRRISMVVHFHNATPQRNTRLTSIESRPVGSLGRTVGPARPIKFVSWMKDEYGSRLREGEEEEEVVHEGGSVLHHPGGNPDSVKMHNGNIRKHRQSQVPPKSGMKHDPRPQRISIVQTPPLLSVGRYNWRNALPA